MSYLRVVIILAFASCLFGNSFTTIRNFKANFTQSIEASKNKNIVYKGEIFLKRPQNILWKYTSPIKKSVYINSSSVLVVEPDLEQVLLSTFNKKMNFIKIFDKAKKITKNTYRAFVNKTVYIIKLKNSVPSEIKYTDKLDNRVTISFTKVRKNIRIPSSIFSYKIPKDYDVIRK